ncbi:MAG: hypothetical protein R2879_19625 [Saprospiraceae bacterium]
MKVDIENKIAQNTDNQSFICPIKLPLTPLPQRPKTKVQSPKTKDQRPKTTTLHPKQAKMKNLILGLFLFAGMTAFAQTPPYFQQLEKKIPEKSNKEFQYIAYFYNHFVNSNIYPTNDFLRGQIIGRLYGQNTTTTSDSISASYFEQRILPFFIYQPKLFDGRAILRASLK